MMLVWAHFKADFLQMLRLPAYIIPTLLFPALFFLIFGSTYASDPETADVIMASFATFAVLGVAFFQFGIGIARDRDSPWEVYTRILPLRPRVRFAAKVLSAMIFALLSASGVVLVAQFTTPVALSAGAWGRLGVGLLVGSVPFALFGIALGYWTRPRAAVPIANLFYLLLSYAGGLWFPPETLPDAVAALSTVLPTRLWGEVVWTGVREMPWTPGPWLGLLAYAALFGALATWGYRRDEGERFR